MTVVLLEQVGQSGIGFGPRDALVEGRAAVEAVHRQGRRAVLHDPAVQRLALVSQRFVERVEVAQRQIPCCPLASVVVGIHIDCAHAVPVIHALRTGGHQGRVEVIPAGVRLDLRRGQCQRWERVGEGEAVGVGSVAGKRVGRIQVTVFEL